MRLLLDDDSNRGSDSVSNTDRELFSDDYSSVNAGQTIEAPPVSENSKTDSNNQSGPVAIEASKPKTDKPKKLDSRKDSLVQKAKRAIQQRKNNKFGEGGKDKSKNEKDGSSEDPSSSKSKKKFFKRNGDNKKAQGKSDAPKDKSGDKSKKEGLLKKAAKNATDGKKSNLKSKLADINKKDPRALAMEQADKYLHLGKKVGFILFVVWSIITLLLTLIFVLPGLIGIVMLNMLLIAPKLNYRITIWILEGVLDFFGVGEVITAVNQIGFTKLDIKIGPFAKFGIIAIDICYGFLLLGFLAFVMSIACWAAGGWGGTLLGWMDSSGIITTLNEICPNLKKE